MPRTPACRARSKVRSTPAEICVSTVFPSETIWLLIRSASLRKSSTFERAWLRWSVERERRGVPLHLLEKLSPVERAVFLLREVFGFEFVEIAIEKSEDNCRQIAVRARRHVEDRQPG